MSKVRIGILGCGGVGGYFGGLLAKKYKQSETCEIIFIVRPETETIIKEQGLKIITDLEQQIIYPEIVTSNTSDFGHFDFIFCCVKSYDLEVALSTLTKNVNSNTVIIPFLNGVDSSERIAKIFPQAKVWYGCVYIVSHIVTKAIIQVKGNIHSLFFGSDSYPESSGELLLKILIEAGIEANYSKNIKSVIWEKYVFISLFASLTTKLDLPIQEVLNNPEHKATLYNLLNEVVAIAEAKRIILPEDIVEKTVVKMMKVPEGTISSMHRDFIKGGKTELASLTEYIVHCGRELNIATPHYNKILSGILSKVLYGKLKI